MNRASSRTLKPHSRRAVPLFNPREFWTPYPVTALARSERWYSRDHHPDDMGRGWRAHTCIPTTYMAYRGLRAYGYRELATLVAPIHPRAGRTVREPRVF